MTVKELIEKLQQFSPEAEVKAVFQGDNPFNGELSCISEIYEIKGHQQRSGVYLEMWNKWLHTADTDWREAANLADQIAEME